MHSCREQTYKKAQKAAREERTAMLERRRSERNMILEEALTIIDAGW
jgi:hypothetical protein